MALKVWGTWVIRYDHPYATPNGQVRAIVATKSRVEAAHLFHMTDGYLKKYGCITGNDEEIAAAMSKPGKIFLVSFHRDLPIVEDK